MPAQRRRQVYELTEAERKRGEPRPEVTLKSQGDTELARAAQRKNLGGRKTSGKVVVVAKSLGILRRREG